MFNVIQCCMVFVALGERIYVHEPSHSPSTSPSRRHPHPHTHTVSHPLPPPSPSPFTLTLQPSTLNPQPSNLKPQTSTLNPQLSSLTLTSRPQPSPFTLAPILTLPGESIYVHVLLKTQRDMLAISIDRVCRNTIPLMLYPIVTLGGSYNA